MPESGQQKAIRDMLGTVQANWQGQLVEMRQMIELLRQAAALPGAAGEVATRLVENFEQRLEPMETLARLDAAEFSSFQSSVGTRTTQER